MNSPRTIDGDSPHFAAALAAADDARRNAQLAVQARQLIGFYSGHRHGVEPFEAEVVVNECLRQVVNRDSAEQQALRNLNTILMAAGGRVGDQFLVRRGVYRVSNPGCLAVHLGAELPGMDEIIAAFEPLPGDDRDEDMAEYSEMIKLPR